MSVDREATVEQFTDIFEEHQRRLVQWFYWRLQESMRSRAEDLAQEAFLGLWEFLLKGGEVTHPFALLKKIGQRRIADEYVTRRRDSELLPVDFGAPESVLIETSTLHRYAPGEPELALVAAGLESAMERMRDASALWRDLHAKAGRQQGRAKPADWVDPNPSRTAKVEAARIEIRLRRDEALVELQEACRKVGSLRAELERAGGECWQSSSGWPPSAARDGRHRKCGALSDPTVKGCPEGHCLADIESVGFLEDGTRVCRACNGERTEVSRQKQKATSGATS